MKYGALLGDLLRALMAGPATEDYPQTRQPAPSRLRGHLIWDPEHCTGCGLCAMDCPADALTLTVIDRKQKHFELEFHLDRCTFCGQCVYSCRFNCLSLQPERWDLAAFDREGFLIRQEKREPQEEAESVAQGA